MKAMFFDSYGSPDVLELREIEKPAIRDDEILVKVEAASLNFGDQALLSGKPWLIRLMGYGLLNPKYQIIGTDIAGRVEAIGSAVREFQPGDEVFADVSGCGFGAFAEYAAIPAEALVLKPANLTFEQAAAVPQAAVVALQGLRDRGEIKSGQKVLINGASGGVGTFAVQIAKAFGADVTGVCSTRNVELVRSIGAGRVIDYTREDFTQEVGCYDLIFDIVANRPLSDYMRALSPQGCYVACAFNPTSLFLGSFFSKAGGKQARSLSQKANTSDLEFVKELLEAGDVTPVVDRCYPLSELAEAMRYLEARRHHGKIVIIIKEDDHGRRTN